MTANTERRPHIWFLTVDGLTEARRAGLAEPRTTGVTGEHGIASPAFTHALAIRQPSSNRTPDPLRPARDPARLAPAPPAERPPAWDW